MAKHRRHHSYSDAELDVHSPRQHGFSCPRRLDLHAATGALLILALLFFPDGIVGTLKHKGRLPKALDWD